MGFIGGLIIGIIIGAASMVTLLGIAAGGSSTDPDKLN